VTTATGGTNISVDKAIAGNAPAESLLTNIELVESAFGEISTGTIVIDAPAGFRFANEVTDEIAVAVNGAEMQIGADVSGTTQSATLVADNVTSFTLYVNAATTTTAATITFSNIKIQPVSTTPAGGNLTVNASSTSTIAGVTEGVTSLGAISSVAATIDHYVVRAADGTSDTTTATVGTNATIKVIPVDVYGNETVGSATAAISATTGPTGATLGVTNADTDAGTDTITTMTFDRAGVYELDVDDTVNNSAGDAAYDLAVTVSAGALSSFNATPIDPIAGSDDDLDVMFVTANEIPNDGKIVLDLPAGYNAAGATVANIDDGDIGTTEPGIVSVTPSDNVGTNDRVTIVLDGNNDPIAAGSTVGFTVSSVRVPQVSGNPGNATATTQDNDGDDIDSVTTDPAGDDTIAAATMTTADVTPDDLKAGVDGTVDVSFTTINPIPADGKIVIEFPTGFNALGSANVLNPVNIDGDFAFALSDAGGTNNVVTLTRSNGSEVAGGTAVSFTIDNVRNPLFAGSAGTYSITTQNASSANVDEKTDVTADTITVNNISLGSVELADRKAGATTTATLTFTTANTIPSDGKIVVDFDDDFDLSGVANGDISSSTLDGNFTVSRNAGSETLTITRSGGSDEAAGVHELVIADVANPSAAQLTSDYAVTTLTAADAEIDTQTNIDGTSIIGTLTATNVQPASLVAGVVGSVTVTFTAEQAVPADGKIAITLPAGFVLDSGSATAVTAGGTYNSTDYSDATVVGQVVTLVGDGAGTGLGAGETATITLSHIKNPTVSGSTNTYSIVTLTTADAEIDSDTAVTADTITAGALTSADVQPASLVAGTQGNATVSFTLGNPVPANGKIVIVFPAGYDLSNVGVGDVSSAADIDGSLSASVAGQTITIVRSGGSVLAAGTTVDDLVIADVKNPGVSGTTGTYSITTATNTNANIDTAASVTADTITVGALTAANVQPASLVAGVDGNVTITFTTANPIPNDGKIVVDFPAGFDATGTTGVSLSDGNGGTTDPTINRVDVANGDGTNDIATVVLNGNNTAIAAGSSVTLVISSIRNPQVSGSAGTYSITTTTGAGTQIDTEASVPADTITAGVLTSANVQPASLVAGSSSNVTVTFTTANPVPTNGKIAVTFPAGFSIANVVSGDISSSSMDGTFTASVVGQVLTITRAGGTAELAGAQTVTISNSHVRNPQVSGSTGVYGIATMTTGGANIDTISNVTADTITVGHIVTAHYSQDNLGAGKTTTASFQFTLVNPLPSDGVLMVRMATDGSHDYDISGVSNLDVSVYNSTQDETLGVDSINTSDLSEPNGIWITLDGSVGANAGDVIEVDVSGIVNPSAATETALGAVRTYLSDATTGIDDISNLNGVTLLSVLSETDVQPASLVAGASTNLSVQLRLGDVLPADGKIVVTLPAGYGVADADTVYGVSGMDGTFSLAANAMARTLTVTRQNDGSPTAAGTQIRFSVSSVANPASVGLAGAYSIYTKTAADVSIEVDDAVLADTFVAVGGGAGDHDQPVISSVVPTPAQTGATITWTTDENATSRVEYGTSTSYGNMTAVDVSADHTSHSVTISGLSPATTYHFRVVSEDASGNVALSSDGTFVTNASDDVTAPIFILSPYAYDISETAAKIKFKSNESGNYSLSMGTDASALSTAASGSVTATSLVSADLSALSANTLYYYELTVEDSSGNESVAGGSFRTNAYNAPEIGNFAFGSITATGVAVSWSNDAASFASAYKISTSSTLAGASWTAVTPSGTGASTQINSLVAATVYYVQVRNVKNGLTTVSPIYTFTTSSANSGVSVRSVVVMKNFGTADNTYMNGWQFRFNITVNDENEQYMKFKLADWLGAQSGAILSSSGNTLGVNPFASVYANESAITTPGISLGTNYAAQSSAFTLIDTDPNTGGIQATFDVFVKLPSNTNITTFTSAYGIKTGATSTITD
jgi:hypothetical protein